MRTDWIKVDVNRLTLRLWKSQGIWLTGVDLRNWLTGQGYSWGGGAWYFCQGMPCDLQPDEILETMVRITEGNVTFVEPPHSSNPESPEI